MAIKMDRDIMRRYAWILGIGFLLVGILGFIDVMTPGDKLLGLFAVNAPHNWIHIITGLLGIGAAMSADLRMPTRFAWFIGIVYALIAILGFMVIPVTGGMLLGFIHTDMADNWLHFLIAVSAFVMLYTSQRRPVYR